MVKFALQFRANLQNIEELRPSGPDFRWYLKFVCTNCGEISEKWNYASINEFTPAPRGNAAYHFVSKCRLCSRENNMSILEDSIMPITTEDQGKFKNIAVFDCRGLHPHAFSPREGWIGKTINNGTVFDDIDLSEGIWNEYCDKIQQPVGIDEIEHRFQKIK